MSEIIELVSQFATQNCLGCHSKSNLSSKFHTESTIVYLVYLLHIKLIAPYSSNILYCNNRYSIATNCDQSHNLSSNFHAKFATQLHKIISHTANIYV